MQDYKHFKIPNGKVLYDITKDSHLFVETSKQEYCISNMWAKAKAFSTISYLHHAYKGQPFDMTLCGDYLPINLEIKNDSKGLKTGNLYFEFYDALCNKGSGYRAPMFKYVHKWLSLLGNTLYEFDAQELKHYLNNSDHETAKTWQHNEKTDKHFLSSVGHVVNKDTLERLHFCLSYNVGEIDYTILPNEYGTILK